MVISLPLLENIQVGFFFLLETNTHTTQTFFFFQWHLTAQMQLKTEKEHEEDSSMYLNIWEKEAKNVWYFVCVFILDIQCCRRCRKGKCENLLHFHCTYQHTRSICLLFANDDYGVDMLKINTLYCIFRSLSLPRSGVCVTESNNKKQKQWIPILSGIFDGK